MICRAKYFEIVIFAFDFNFKDESIDQILNGLWILSSNVTETISKSVFLDNFARIQKAKEI